MRAYQSKSYQQNEWTTSGMELYDFHARMYDPVIGRWHAPDPMNQFDSPYTAMADNPVVRIDPDGMWVPTGGIVGALGMATGIFNSTRVVGFKIVEHAFTKAEFCYSTTEPVYGSTTFGDALQLAGAALAFNEGSQILSDGQHALGAAAINEDHSYLTTNNIGAPVRPTGNIPRFETDVIENPKNTDKTANLRIGGNIYQKKGDHYIEIFFVPDLRKDPTGVVGYYYYAEPQVNNNATISAIGTLNITLDDKGEIDAATKATIDATIDGPGGLLASSRNGPPFDDDIQPRYFEVFGEGRGAADPAQNKLLMSKVAIYIKQKYHGQYQVTQSNLPWNAVGSAPLPGQVTLDIHFSFYVYPF
jgi:RHS repeat-associated protein